MSLKGGAAVAWDKKGDYPPPVWRRKEDRPKRRATVTDKDLKAFQHFWLANEEHKLLIVAIPKVIGRREDFCS